MSRKLLERLCERHRSLNVLASLTDALSALEFVNTQTVDLLWLDVELPGLSGLELLRQLPIIPYVVLTTSKSEFALDVSQYGVTDYLKKPITLPRFELAVERILKANDRVKEHEEIYIKTAGGCIRLPYTSISYIQAMGGYTKIYTIDEEYVVYATLKRLVEELGYLFMRVHRSFIVRLDLIIDVDIENSRLVVADKVIPMSRTNQAELMSRLNLL